MKRFWKEVTVEAAEGGFRLALDGRPIRTQGGAPQVVPSRELAEAMAEEWRAQGEDVDPRQFVLRDLADFALDKVAPDRAGSVDALMPFAETDTLCYRADPDEPLYRRQQEVWEPLLTALEARHGIRMERVSGIVHRPQPPASLAALRAALLEQDAFALAALRTMAPLAASVTVALAALEDRADPAALFAAANCEEDWQAELWGWDPRAEEDRATRLAAFTAAADFARWARA
ncbi:molecular chaperone [Altererythrobacter sp. B11]|uniref:ATP12 family chaperone protein n=1 Tax=Altererythrobacter sp. B11 TaxID=2060312 RepID=UPI000DC73CDC|nr:ATP12 family protein [Altererythrobacter sp. B11]BBC74201.1 molecular chaperone [Altererythrobacter sp. B11]